jgi:methylthioxylose transferase
VLLALAAAVVILLADLSGLSKAETERIWLPFTVWLLPAVSLLPPGSRRGWLTVQAVTALAVNHLVLTFW